MNTKIYQLLIGICLVWMTSCDDFLNVQPKGKVIPKKCEDYESLLNSSQLMNVSESYTCYLTDDVFLPYKDDLTGGYAILTSPKKRLYTFKSEVFSDGDPDELWDLSYNHIYMYNVIIEGVMKSTQATEEHKKQVRAEALLGRAFEYLTLVNAYSKHYDPATAAADPGVPLRLDESINKTNLVRASVQAVYNQIKADLDEAVLNLPKKSVSNAFRASKSVGYGMLARMYLYMGNYAKALENAKIVLEHNSALLDMSPYKVTNPEKKAGRIDVPARADNPENIYIRLATSLTAEFDLSLATYGSADLMALYDKKKDQRYLLYFTRDIAGIKSKYDAWAPFIYANVAMATPEIYLIAAECEARAGRKDKAMEYINALRDKRILKNVRLVANSNKEALKMVLDERRRELRLIGCIRLIDLKRLNREPEFAKTVIHELDGVKYKLEPNDPKYILPIPPNVLRFNPGMPPNKR